MAVIADFFRTQHRHCFTACPIKADITQSRLPHRHGTDAFHRYHTSTQLINGTLTGDISHSSHPWVHRGAFKSWASVGQIEALTQWCKEARQPDTPILVLCWSSVDRTVICEKQSRIRVVLLVLDLQPSYIDPSVVCEQRGLCRWVFPVTVWQCKNSIRPINHKPTYPSRLLALEFI